MIGRYFVIENRVLHYYDEKTLSLYSNFVAKTNSWG